MNQKNGTTKLVRPKFGPGMLLQHEDLELLNSYTQNLSRLLFRSFFGCGVICGLKVLQPKVDCGKLIVDVESGVALTCQGDPVWVPEKTPASPPDNIDLSKPLWVVLCRAVKHCGTRTSVCDSGDDAAAAVCTREVEAYEIRVEKSPKGFCGCPEPKPKSDTKPQSGSEAASHPPCYDDHYNGICGCGCVECTNCDCDCIILARLDYQKAPPTGQDNWTVDHRVRRFIRPMLMPDHQVAIEESDRQKATQNAKKQKQEPTPASTTGGQPTSIDTPKA